MHTHFKRTKILATLGPASRDESTIHDLIASGVNGFRFNFSHAKHDECTDSINVIRRISTEKGKPIAILQDLQGPKIRLGELKNDVEVHTGDEITLAYEAEHDGGLYVPVQYNLAEKVQVGEPLYIFDGKIQSTVTDIRDDGAIVVKVQNNGVLMSRKGINLPDTNFEGDILTAKDLADIEFGASSDIDYVALSFVQSADDIHNLRQILLAHGSQAQVIAKIETKAAIQPGILEEIVEASDGVMVARGDLAIEVGAEVVPIVQRDVIALCRKHGKLSIVATQMISSMVDSLAPTRSEASDISNAVVQGTDVVMLSEETASGKYPVEAVRAMKKIIIYTQDHSDILPLRGVVEVNGTIQDAISHAAIEVADQVGAVAIICETRSGATAANIAVHRPKLPIISVTSEVRSYQQLALSYANKSFVRPDGEKAGRNLAKELKDRGFFGEDINPFIVVIVSGRQPGLSGGTDTIRVRVIE